MPKTFFGLGPTVGTYAERVALVSPEIGQLFYQTDTDEYLEYSAFNGSNRWVQAAPRANKNFVINGGMGVAQRGVTSAGSTTGGYLTCDRWTGAISSLGTWTNTQENDAPVGIGKSWKWLCTTADASPAAADFALVRQGVEGQNLQTLLKGTAAAKLCNVSFWVKSNVVGTYVLYLNDNVNTRIICGSYSISSVNTWEYKTVTLAGDTVGALTNSNVVGIYLSFGLAFGSNYTSAPLQTSWSTGQTGLGTGQVNVAAAVNNYWQITGVQWEVGSAPSEFEFETFETTLRKCQRYFCKTFSYGTVPASNAGQPGSLLFPKASTTAAGGAYAQTWRFPVEMRDAPNPITTYSPSAAGANFFDEAGGAVLVAVGQIGTGGVFVYNSGAAVVGRNAVIHVTAQSEL